MSQPRERTSDGYRNSGGNYGYTKKKVFVKRKVNHTHVEQGVDEGEDCDEMECIEEEKCSGRDHGARGQCGRSAFFLLRM